MIGIYPILRVRYESNSVIEGWRILQRLPLKAVVAEYDERDSFVLDDMEKLARTGAKLVFILVVGPWLAVGGEKALHDDGVDGEEYGARIRKVNKD
jgi:hypothetical protein